MVFFLIYNTPLKLQELDNYFQNLLSLPLWVSKDISSNGLQVSRKNQEIQKVAFAVDASLQSFRRAVESGADLLVVHHGLFWGRPIPLTGPHYDRIRFLLDHDLGLYAAHLPLDAHPEVGNNYGMGKMLGLENIQPFGDYKGNKIGCKGTLPQPLTLDKIAQTLVGGREKALEILRFGPAEIRTVGIVSGGATMEVLQAIDENLDLFVTGDADHTVYHTALEAGINVIFGGHYATETWGVRLLAQRLKQDTGLETQFLDLPTGL